MPGHLPVACYYQLCHHSPWDTQLSANVDCETHCRRLLYDIYIQQPLHGRCMLSQRTVWNGQSSTLFHAGSLAEITAIGSYLAIWEKWKGISEQHLDLHAVYCIPHPHMKLGDGEAVRLIINILISPVQLLVSSPSLKVYQHDDVCSGLGPSLFVFIMQFIISIGSCRVTIKPPYISYQSTSICLIFITWL